MGYYTDVAVMFGWKERAEDVARALNAEFDWWRFAPEPQTSMVTATIKSLGRGEIARAVREYDWEDPLGVKVMLRGEDSDWRELDWTTGEYFDESDGPGPCTENHCQLHEQAKAANIRANEANNRLPSERQDALTVIARTFGRDWEECLREIQAMILRDPALRREMENSTPHPNYVELALRYPGPWWKRAANT